MCGCTAPTAPQDNDTTADPQPDPSTYTVTYDGNQNSEGTEVVVLGNSGGLEASGHAFAGWNTESGGTGAYYFPGEILVMGKQDVTLYAIYNLLLNGNMEQWTEPPDPMPAAWVRLNLDAGTYSQVEGHIGGFAVRLESPPGSDIGITQTVSDMGELPPVFYGQ